MPVANNNITIADLRKRSAERSASYYLANKNKILERRRVARLRKRGLIDDDEPQYNEENANPNYEQFDNNDYDNNDNDNNYNEAPQLRPIAQVHPELAIKLKKRRGRVAHAVAAPVAPVAAPAPKAKVKGASKGRPLKYNTPATGLVQSPPLAAKFKNKKQWTVAETAAALRARGDVKSNSNDTHIKSMERLGRFLDLSRGFRPWIQSGARLVAAMRNLPYANTTKAGDMNLILLIIDKLPPPNDFGDVDDLRDYASELALENDDRQAAASTAAHVSWKDYFKSLDMAGDSPTSKARILAMLYRETPMRDDFGGLRIVTTKQVVPGNSIYIPKAGLIVLRISEYKTERRGTQQVTLSQTLSNAIRAYLPTRPANIIASGTLFGVSSLSQYLTNTHKRLGYQNRTGIKFFRQIATPLDTASNRDKVKAAKLKGHSVNTAARAYTTGRI